MNVRQMIEYLSTKDPDAKVVSQNCRGGSDEYNHWYEVEPCFGLASINESGEMEVVETVVAEPSERQVELGFKNKVIIF
jgi:hypothetical protein